MRVHDIPVFGVREIIIKYDDENKMYDIILKGDDKYEALTIRAYPEDDDEPPRLAMENLQFLSGLDEESTDARP